MAKIGVFCSASSDIDSDFLKAAENLGKWIGKNNHMLVFGGCNMGLMECIAKATHMSGAMTIGIIPIKMEKSGKKSESTDVTIPSENLSDRKELMMLHGDVFVALPGGIGTLDEIMTLLASATLDFHTKKVILLNIKGFWDPLINLFEHFQKEGMMRNALNESILIAKDEDELTFLLTKILDGG